MTTTDVRVDDGNAMTNLSGKLRGNLSAAANPAESEAASLVARARTMMMISTLTMVLAIAAVVTVIGYRIYGAGSAPVEDMVMLPKGAHIVSMVGSGGRVAVMIDNAGRDEMRVFDLKTMKETGRLRFGNEQ